ncbi:MAG: hypothetical protein LQ338_007975 [Usnochroma carphineum]|nr:MAG: hypothetical protein LQ338_007975 [Usnochroma carphineum]
MLAFKPLGLLTFPPLVSASLSTCRLVPPLQYQQCPAPWTDFRSVGRSHFNHQSARASHSSTNSSSITYRVAAAFSAKGWPFQPQHNFFSFDPTQQSSDKPPFTGRPASGQDAFFVSNVGHSSSTAFGVADGVGGWTQSGIDPADFSHGLCRYLANNAQDHHGQDRLSARQLLERGYRDVVADEEITGGGSTACVAVGDSLGYLEVAK